MVHVGVKCQIRSVRFFYTNNNRGIKCFIVYCHCKRLVVFFLNRHDARAVNLCIKFKEAAGIGSGRIVLFRQAYISPAYTFTCLFVNNSACISASLLGNSALKGCGIYRQQCKYTKYHQTQNFFHTIIIQPAIKYRN